jgi:hypothetical protein
MRRMHRHEEDLTVNGACRDQIVSPNTGVSTVDSGFFFNKSISILYKIANIFTFYMNKVKPALIS